MSVFVYVSTNQSLPGFQLLSNLGYLIGEDEVNFQIQWFRLNGPAGQKH
jgi:hypothetical protein